MQNWPNVCFQIKVSLFRVILLCLSITLPGGKSIQNFKLIITNHSDQLIKLIDLAFLMDASSLAIWNLPQVDPTNGLRFIRCALLARDDDNTKLMT